MPENQVVFPSATTVSSFAADMDENKSPVPPSSVTVNGVSAWVNGTTFTAYLYSDKISSSGVRPPRLYSPAEKVGS